MNNILGEYGKSIFSVVSRLAESDDVLDLGQGYPTYSPPEALLECLSDVESVPENHQYEDTRGNTQLRNSLAELYENLYGLDIDAENELTVTSGATEAIHSALMGYLNPGDEVICFEPVYDQYIPVSRRAGAEVETLPLTKPDYELPLNNLEDILSQRTDLIIFNNPHNPTGRVFEEQEIKDLLFLAKKYDVSIFSDEVYEHLVYDESCHRPLLGFEDAKERVLMFGSAGKSFDATGWKIGWALGNKDLIEALRLSHQFTTYCSTTPLQSALSSFLKEFDPDEFFRSLKGDYSDRREILLKGLENSEFRYRRTSGTYFVTAKFPELSEGINSNENLVREIIDRIGIAAIPLNAFYEGNGKEGSTYRFAFCKDRETLRHAAKKLSRA